MNLKRQLRRLVAAQPRAAGFSFSRPLVLLQSDDWGRVGVRDREGYELLRARGIDLGSHSYDFYSMETAEDVVALRDMLHRHRDSTGRSACMVMNFLLANVDFPKVTEGEFTEIHLKPLSQGLPGNWQRQRPGLFEAYSEGIAQGLFHPGLHGLTHFCGRAVERELNDPGARGTLLRNLWSAETPYIYWRMPWVGYEYYDPAESTFPEPGVQRELVRKAAAGFREFFGVGPLSACAPGYRANQETHRAWLEHGVQVAQNGCGPCVPPHMDPLEILNLYRTIDVEPAHRILPVEEYLRVIDRCLARGWPAIISVHSINFHSTLKDFRGPTLKALDQLLTALERKYSDLLYVHDADLYQIVTHGRFRAAQGTFEISVSQSECGAVASAGAN